MAVQSSRVTVGTSATRLDVTAETDYAPGAATFQRTFGQSVTVRNKGTVPIYLGKLDVTTSTGFQVDPDEAFSADLVGTDALYGVAGTAGQTVHVLQTGV